MYRWDRVSVRLRSYIGGQEELLPLLFLLSSFHLFIHLLIHLGSLIHSLFFFLSSFLYFYCFFFFSFCFWSCGASCFCCFWQLRRINENIGIVCFLPHFLPFYVVLLRRRKTHENHNCDDGDDDDDDDVGHGEIKFIHEIQQRPSQKKKPNEW